MFRLTGQVGLEAVDLGLELGDKILEGSELLVGGARVFRRHDKRNEEMVQVKANGSQNRQVFHASA